MSHLKGIPQCIGIWNYASDYFLSANTLRGAETGLRHAPTYYLYAHAIELTLKSYLCYNGFNTDKLKKCGHNLNDLWGKSVVEGLDKQLTNATEIQQCLELINPYYHGKELEYIYPGTKRYPLISNIHNVGRELVITVGKNIEIPPPQLYRFTQFINE